MMTADSMLYDTEADDLTSAVVSRMSIINGILGADSAQPLTTDTPSYDSPLLGEPITWETLDESFLDHLPVCQLLIRLDALGQTIKDKRWPSAVLPADQAFEDARTFICRLPRTLTLMPEISLADDGEINFLWEYEGVHVDLGFYGTGACSYFARNNDGCRLHGENVSASEGLPAEVTNLLKV